MFEQFFIEYNIGILCAFIYINYFLTYSFSDPSHKFIRTTFPCFRKMKKSSYVEEPIEKQLPPDLFHSDTM